MYTSIAELPTQVTASLDEHDAEIWMNLYNQVLGDGTDKEAIKHARRTAWEGVKNNPSSFSFCIKASVEDIDRYGEVIDVQSIKEHMDSFIEYGGNVQTEHGNYTVATIWAWEEMVDEEGRPGLIAWGNIFGGDQVYDQARQDFINGRNSLSVAGEATHGKYLCDEKGCYIRRTVKQLMEISLCTIPANRHATLVWYNPTARMRKSASEAMFSINEYTLHKDYTACQIQSIKRSMLNAGFKEVHARPDGVLVPMSEAEYNWQKPSFEARGLYAVKLDNGVLINTEAKMHEHMYKSCLSQGYIDRYGFIKSTMPKAVFNEMAQKGFMEHPHGVYMMTLPKSRQ